VEEQVGGQGKWYQLEARHLGSRHLGSDCDSKGQLNYEEDALYSKANSVQEARLPPHDQSDVGDV